MFCDQDPVFLLVLVTWMREAVGQLAVIGHQNQAFRIHIQAPNGMERAGYRHQVPHRSPAVWGGHGREDTARLI